MQHEGERGINWLLQVFIFVWKPVKWLSNARLLNSWLLKCISWSVSLKTLIHNFLKDLSKLYVCVLQDTEQPWLSSEQGRANKHALCGIPATKGKLKGLSRPLMRRKREKGRQRPLEPLIFIPGPTLSSLRYLFPSTIPILLMQGFLLAESNYEHKHSR